MDPFVTFIVPTVGRPTLQRTLESLVQQTEQNWKCLVGFDGIPVQIVIEDPRIQYMGLPKAGGNKNFGGGVRNQLLNITTSPWAAFVDDDDTVRPTYVASLRDEIQTRPDATCIIFRMSYDEHDTNVLPPLGTTRLQLSKVGISFAVQTKFLNQHKIRFVNGPVEDFHFLKRVERFGAPFVWSRHIEYNVRF
jgi:glycosyltransferase involved in cell wall biosynthesis